MDFACKNITLMDLLKCSLNLNKTSFKTLFALIKSKKQLSINELASKTKLTNSSVQKAVKQLLEKNLINRHQINNQKGGYYFNYFIKDKQRVKQLIIKEINNWSTSIIKQVTDL